MKKKNKPSEQEIREKVKEYFKDMPDFATHYEDGNVSMWTFKHHNTKPGERSVNINCGDGGAAMMMRAMDKAMREELKKFKDGK